MEIGNALRNAREARGISLGDVEDAIKIRRKYLEAMENEQFDILPGKVYVKGFLKNYARYLGLDADRLAAMYLESVADNEDDAGGNEDVPVQTEKRRFNLRPVLGVLLIGAILTVGAVGLLPSIKNIGQFKQPPGAQQNDPASRQPDASPAPDNKGVAPDNNDQAPLNEEKQEGVDLVLNVTDKTSWMQVVVDDRIQFTGEVPAGESKSFRGQEKIWIKLGNAGVVEVQLNGKNIGVLGARGEVVNKLFAATPQG